MSGTAENGAATMGKEKTEFLDSGQYTVNGITRYERIFGRNYVSEGGLQSTQVGQSDYTLALWAECHIRLLIAIFCNFLKLMVTPNVRK